MARGFVNLRHHASRWTGTHPQSALLLIALLLRVLAAIFARGYMGTDDHYQVIEIAADWQRGNGVFLSGDTQFYRSLFYPAVNWLLMWLCHSAGIYHPDWVMIVNRLAHALFSLWAVTLTYRIGLRVADSRAAWTAGLLVAAHAVMPYAAVRNLIETACIPFLLWGLHEILMAEEAQPRHSIHHWFVAGIALGIAFVVRWQVAAGLIGVGIHVLLRRRWSETAWLVTGLCLPIVAQGIADWYMHGVFLGSVWAYLQHNMTHARSYVVGPWYRYTLLVLGIFVPPFSLLLVWGMIRYWRRLGLVAWTATTFLIVHSIVPGKQERFLLPIFPLLALMGAAGVIWWAESRSELWRRWTRIGWGYFWSVNAILLVLAIFNYSQKARIAALIEMYEQGDATGVIADFTDRGTLLPRYYLDGADPTRPAPLLYEIRNTADLDTLRLRQSGAILPGTPPIRYALVFASGDPESHFQMLREHFGPTEVIAHITPSLADWLLQVVNPKYNHSKESWVCRVTARE